MQRFGSMIWAVARAHRLGDADAADVAQATWTALIGHLGQIKAAFKMTYAPATDESALNDMLQNTQPTLAWSTCVASGCSWASRSPSPTPPTWWPRRSGRASS